MKHPFLLILAALLFGQSVASAQSADTPLTTPTPQQPNPLLPRTLVAGVYINEPFCYQTKDGYTGFCVDLWKEIAADLNLQIEYIPFTKLSDLLEATSQDKVDLALGNISITGERLKMVDFSQPYLQGGMQIMIDEKRGSSFEKLWIGLRDSGHLKIFGIGISIILFFTVFLTIAERYWNKEFHSDWGNGLAESFYHVMSITMTGKSTHKGLPGPFGKILAGIWLAFGVGVVAYITSSITSVMTVNRLQGIIKGPQDLPGHHVGAIGGTLAQQYCEDQSLNTTLYSNLPDAVKALVHHEIEAIVFDAMTLQWYDNAHPELPITEVGPIFMKKGYGFALPLKSPLRHEINRALLKQQESGFEETLRKHYFGDIP
jgi:polar amino acid transport system substrate-binding protein